MSGRAAVASCGGRGNTSSQHSSARAPPLVDESGPLWEGSTRRLCETSSAVCCRVFVGRAASPSNSINSDGLTETSTCALRRNHVKLRLFCLAGLLEMPVIITGVCACRPRAWKLSRRWCVRWLCWFFPFALQPSWWPYEGV